MESLHTEIIPDPESPEEQPKSNWRRALIDTLETIILSLALFLVINAISERIRVESISMQPNLIPGDFVIVNKLAIQVRRLARTRRCDCLSATHPTPIKSPTSRG